MSITTNDDQTTAPTERRPVRRTRRAAVSAVKVRRAPRVWSLARLARMFGAHAVALSIGIAMGAFLSGAAETSARSRGSVASGGNEWSAVAANWSQDDLKALEHASFVAAVRPQVRKVRVRLNRGEDLAHALRRAGVSQAESEGAAQGFFANAEAAPLAAGQSLTLYMEPAGSIMRLAGFSATPRADLTLSVALTPNGDYRLREMATVLRDETRVIKGVVRSSLFAAIRKAGAGQREAAAFSDIMSFDLDFQRGTGNGDRFEMAFDARVNRRGEIVESDRPIFVSYTARGGRTHSYYRFVSPTTGKADYYDADGKSGRKALMKTPVNGAQLGSGYGMRFHPILGYSRMHKGVDFKAPIGTPIMAAGDGEIAEAGNVSGYGRYIRIVHAGHYETAYGHLSGFARNTRVGRRVSQGEVIGFVGSSGLSTGPHLHYEVLFRGNHVNPMSVPNAAGRVLRDEELTAFLAERDRIDAVRRGELPKPLDAAPVPTAPLVMASVEGADASDGDDVTRPAVVLR